MRKKSIAIALVIFIFICFFVEIIGSFWTKESLSTWYPTLAKPSWTPPNWLFGPVWSILYLMIAVSGWLIYSSKDSHQRNVALIFYGIQLALNFIWSFLFFSLRSPALGLIDITLLCLFIVLAIFKAWPVRPFASYLLLPYLLWVVYAVSLNAGIWLLNW